MALGGTKVEIRIPGGLDVEAAIESRDNGRVWIGGDGWSMVLAIDAVNAQRLARFFADHAARSTGQKGGG